MKSIFTCVAILFCITATAQQKADNHFYAQNPYLIDPSFAGYKAGINTFAWGNSSFQGIEGSPKSFLVGVQAAVEKTGFGVGGKLRLDQRGIYESFSFEFSAAYKLLLDNFQLVSFALDAGFINYSTDFSSLNDQVDFEDPTLYSDHFNRTNIKLGMGVSYLNQKLQVGFALPRLVEGGEPLNKSFNLYGSYLPSKFSSPWSYRPSLLIQGFDDGSLQVEGNIMASYNEVLWGQAGYNTSKTILLATGLNWEMLGVGYHFSLPLASTNDFFVNQHEILLSINFARQKRLGFIREKRKRRKIKLKKNVIKG